jgi:hypothetical protein
MTYAALPHPPILLSRTIAFRQFMQHAPQAWLLFSLHRPIKMKGLFFALSLKSAIFVFFFYGIYL